MLDSEGNEINNYIIPDGVTSIGNYAFAGCTGLTSIIFSNSLTSIGSYAFSGCTALSSITFPSGVTSINDHAFYGCNTLTSVNIRVLDLAAYCSNSIANQIRLSINKPIHLLDNEGNEIKNCIIPDSVSSIGNYAFYSCTGLTTVQIPNNVTSIGECAFYGTNIKTLILGTGVLSIGNYAFSTHPQKTIWLTNTPPTNYYNAQGSINYVANNQYSGLSNMKEYKFLSSIFEVDGIKYVPISPSDRTCDVIDCVYDESSKDININPKVSYKGIVMNVLNVMPYSFYGNNYLQKVNYDNSSNICKYVFYGCQNLQTAILNKNIRGIEEYAFCGCSSLKDIIIPDSVQSVGQYAFSECSSLPGFVLPSSTNSIGNYVFSGCKSLKVVILSDNKTESVLSIGSNGNNPLFADCPLDSVYIGRNISYNKNSNYGYSPFYRNTSLRSVVITDKEEEISENEFYGCTNLKNVQIGDGVTTIANWAFSGCASLQHFAFGTQVKTIGKESFSDCTAVTAIISKAQTPPTCSSQALDDINKWTCTLTVPTGCKDSYAAADQWKEFFFVEEGDGGGQQNPDTPETKKCEKPTISYSNGKLTFSCATEGATCMSTIKDTDITSYTTNEVQLSVTYTVSVYATLAGYEDSDIATATLCWIDQQPATEGMIDGIANVPAKAVLIQSIGGQLTIEGANDGERISVYGINGTLAGSAVSQNGQAVVGTNLQPGSVAIVKIGEKSVKVVVK